MESHFRRMFDERNTITKTCVICGKEKILKANSTSLLSPYACKDECQEKYMKQIEEREESKLHKGEEKEGKEDSVGTPIISHSEPLN